MTLTERESNCVSVPPTLVKSFKEKLPSLEKEGLIYLAHGIKRQGVRTCFFSHDAWAELFLTHQKYKTDPLTRMAETTSLPYFLWEQVEMNEQEQEVSLARQETCRIIKGLTFSIYAYDFHEIIALGTSHRFLDMMDLVLNPVLNTYLSTLIQPIRYQHLKYRYQDS